MWILRLAIRFLVFFCDDPRQGGRVAREQIDLAITFCADRVAVSNRWQAMEPITIWDGSVRNGSVSVCDRPTCSWSWEPLRRRWPQVQQVYEQMAEPRLVLAVAHGALERRGSSRRTACYRGIHWVVSVYVDVPGCPPRPNRSSKVL